MIKALLALLPKLIDLFNQWRIQKQRKSLEKDIEDISNDVAGYMAGDRVRHSDKTLADLHSSEADSESDSAG